MILILRYAPSGRFAPLGYFVLPRIPFGLGGEIVLHPCRDPLSEQDPGCNRSKCTARIRLNGCEGLQMEESRHG